jgi:eukaryotic-like serine/threonine-protein kinase
MTVAGRFTLMRPIGHGGMGLVWLAERLSDRTACAVKFIEGEPWHEPRLVARLEREAEIEARVRSAHVVRILEQGFWKGTPYVAMEYLDGETLWQLIHRERKLDAATTQRIVAHVARALTGAHAIGVVHRDLKPENVFLVAAPDGVLAKVFDFGVAKGGAQWDGRCATMPGQLIGSPPYMSPEQARGARDVDARTDLWALAVITYRCLTGERPFNGEGLGELFSKIAVDPIPMPSAAAPELGAAFDAWWVRATCRDPNGRFQTAKELSDALAMGLGIADPVQVSEPTAPARWVDSIESGVALTRRWQPSSPRGRAGAFGVAIVAAAGIAFRLLAGPATAGAAAHPRSVQDAQLKGQPATAADPFEACGDAGAAACGLSVGSRETPESVPAPNSLDPGM